MGLTSMPSSGPPARIGHLPRQGFLADGGHPVLGSEFDHHPMRRGSGRDVDEVEGLGGEQLPGIRVRASTELRGSGSGARCVDVADGHEFDIVHLRPGVEMVLREEARPDQGEATRHSSTSRLASVIHSLHEPTYMREPERPAISMARTFCAAVMPEPQ